MTVFAVIAPGDNPALSEAVAREFAGRAYKISDGQFLVVADKATISQITEQLGAPTGAIGKILVLPVTSYGGWHDRGIWEWLGVQGVPPIPGAPIVTPWQDAPLPTITKND